MKQKGIASFILHYRTAENAVFPNPADDVAQAVKFILGNIEKNITGQYPPTFIWNCKEDSCVPCDNSVMLVEALKSNDVKVMYEVYPGNAHGWGLGTDTLADGWLDRAVEFLING